MDDNCPASLALRYAVSSSEFLRGRRCRPRCNRFGFIVNNLRVHKMDLKTVDNLYDLKNLAYDRARWRGMFVFRDYQG